MLKRIAIAAVALSLLAIVGEVAGPYAPAGAIGLIGTAEAVVGRPLTPVSVAGVTRRTARRCAAGVYNC